MAEIVLYGNPLSTFVRSVRMALVEKGLAYDLDPVDYKSPEYRKIHPFGKVPALRHGDFLLYESTAILAYIDEAFPGPRLQPADPKGRARMNQWIGAANDYLYSAVIRRWVLEVVFPKGADGKPDQEKIDAALPDARHHLGVFDAALADQPYLAGQEVSLADLVLLPIVFYAAKMPDGREMVPGFANLWAWHGRMEKRESFAATLPPKPGK